MTFRFREFLTELPVLLVRYDMLAIQENRGIFDDQ